MRNVPLTTTVESDECEGQALNSSQLPNFDLRCSKINERLALSVIPREQLRVVSDRRASVGHAVEFERAGMICPIAIRLVRGSLFPHEAEICSVRAYDRSVRSCAVKGRERNAGRGLTGSSEL